MKKLRGEKDIEATLERLDRLTLDEARATAVQTLEVVYSLVRHRRVVMGGEMFYQTSSSLDTKWSHAGGNESADSISGVLGMSKACWRHPADMMSNWVVESIQEIVSKMNKAERGLFIICNLFRNDWGN
jgi:hypothetical protein